MTFEAHMKPSTAGNGWAVWVHRVGDSPKYLDSLASTYCSTSWGAKRWARRKARQLAVTSWQIEVTP